MCIGAAHIVCVANHGAGAFGLEDIHHGAVVAASAHGDHDEAVGQPAQIMTEEGGEQCHRTPAADGDALVVDVVFVNALHILAVHHSEMKAGVHGYDGEVALEEVIRPPDILPVGEKPVVNIVAMGAEVDVAEGGKVFEGGQGDAAGGVVDELFVSIKTAGPVSLNGRPGFEVVIAVPEAVSWIIQVCDVRTDDDRAVAAHAVLAI